MMIAIAIRAPSLGILLIYCCIVSPIAGFFAIISIFLCTWSKSACSENSLVFVMYSEDWNQSFQ